MRHADSPHGFITISAGVACWQPGREPATPAALVEAADAALYAAKAAGRNIFVVHHDAARSTQAAA